MALTLRGSGQVSADNYGIDSDGSITATGKSLIKNNNSYATSSQTSYDNASLRLDNLTGGSSIGTSFGVITPNVNYIQSGYNEGTTAPLTLNPYGGNVGIGTSSPSEKLDVSGNIRALGPNSRVLFGPDGFEAGIKYATDAALQIASRANETITFTNGNDGAERMRIDSSGRVTTPSQPSFLAHTMTGFNSSSTIMKNFVVIQHNTGGHFSNSTGLFTAPVAGKYLVNSGILVGTGTGRLEFNVEVNSGSPYLAGNGTGTTYDGPTLSAVFNLSVNDNIRVRLVSGTPHSNGNHPNTYFGVTLLG